MSGARPGRPRSTICARFVAPYLTSRVSVSTPALHGIGDGYTAFVPLAVLPLVLLAAVFHATWNALLKASENPLSLATRAMTWGTVLSLPPVAVAWLVTGRPGLPLAGWLLAIASGALELIYFITLSTAYGRGELSVVYPIARGTAPLLAVGVGLVLPGERLQVAAAVGVVCLLAGI